MVDRGGKTYHDHGEEDARAHLLEQHVCERFEERVADEEDGERGIVLAIRHFQVRLQAVDFGVADVGPVEEGCQSSVTC